MPRDATDDRIISALADCRAAIRTLGLDARGGRVTARSAMVLSPWRSERSPSCHLSIVSGELYAYDHGSGVGGDAYDLAAAVWGLDARRDLRAVKERLASLLGIELERGVAPIGPPPPRPPPPPPRPYPPADEVAALWASTVPVGDDATAAAWLLSRGLDVAEIEDGDLARVLRLGSAAPAWASYQGRTWLETGHRVLVRAWDATGTMRSVRAIRIVDGDTPKRLPPAGYRAGELVLADALGRLILAGIERDAWPSSLRIVVAEGEPDWLTLAAHASDADEHAPAVLGVQSGSWCAEIAARIPDGADVIIRTDEDDAGDRYAEQIAATLCGRCRVVESGPAGRAERRRTRPAREAARLEARSKEVAA